MGCCLSSDYEPPPSCDYCRNLPSNDIFVAKIYHCEKYNGVHLCKTCLYKKINKIETKYSSI